MGNYRFLIEYDGSRFYGWEHQPNTDMTIQGKLEAVLKEMTGQEIEVIGSGRTDAGVHAKGMVANAHFNSDKSLEEIREYMNYYLPEDICVCEVSAAADRFHSRYNACGKTYRYTCYVGDVKPVFERKYACIPWEQTNLVGNVYTPEAIRKKPDIELMRRAAKHLVGEHDFKSFCGNPKMKKSTVREIFSIDIEQKDDYIYMTFHGSGFLQYMVRILSGTLLEVGYGKRSPDSMTKLLLAKDRKQAGFTAPAKGLCMIKVDYC